MLRAYDELSFEAVGEVIGLNAVAARKRYSRALSSLRESLLRRTLSGLGIPA